MGPSIGDFTDFMVAAGIIAEAPGDTTIAEAYLSQAVQQLSKDTNWFPFYAPESATVTLDVKKRTELHTFRTGILTLTELTVGGSARTVDVDFYLRGAQTGPPEKPNYIIEFVGVPDIGRDMISMTGVFGFTSEEDPVINHAIMKLAAAGYTNFLSYGSTSASGVVTQQKLGDFSRSYAVPAVNKKGYMGRAALLYDDYKATVETYKRWRL